MMRKQFIFNLITIMSLILTSVCAEFKEAEHESHHEHTEETTQTDPSADQGDDHGRHENEAAGTHEEKEEKEIELSPEAMKMAEITVTKARTGRIKNSLDVSGEVSFNEDSLVHITPRYSGIAKDVVCKVGDIVKAGDIVATIESNESLTLYPLKAPLSGTIIEKHISPGEHVSVENSIYVLADLSNVWVNLAVYPKDALKIKPGQKVTITAVGSDNRTEGTLHYVTPVMDVQTRRITARVILQNDSSTWRPGSFVNAHIEIGEGDEGVVVDKSALQILGDKNVVFVQHEPNCFKPVEVTTGESDFTQIRILKGLEAGAEYVSNGAFELKAKIVTSSLGEHAGHGH